jgi:hypothetical protein
MSKTKGGRVSRLVAAMTTAAYLAGCATASKDVATAYVSPTQYQVYDCQQLGAEAQRLQVRFTELGGRLDQAASNDKTLTGVGLILFWPALFALGGTKNQEAEYGRLRGEYEAVQQASIHKKCAMGPVSVPATAPLPASSPASSPV